MESEGLTLTLTADELGLLGSLIAYQNVLVGTNLKEWSADDVIDGVSDEPLDDYFGLLSLKFSLANLLGRVLMAQGMPDEMWRSIQGEKISEDGEA